MTIRYSLSRGDVLLGQMDALLRNRVMMGFWLILAGAIAYSGISQPDVIAKGALAVAITGLITVAIIFSMLFTFTMVVTGLMILLRKNKGVVGSHTLSITSEGLIESTDYNETLHRWNGFHRIFRTKRYLYIYVTESTAHFVPLKSKLIEGDIEAFQRELATKVQL
jgi:hypothetical protein